MFPQTKIHVVRRDTGRVTTTQYVTETFFFLHTINAYEDRGHIVLDIAAYKNAEMLHCMFVEALKVGVGAGVGDGGGCAALLGHECVVFIYCFLFLFLYI